MLSIMEEPVATILGVSPENILANQLPFGSDGDFMGFDTKEPTSRSGGKANAVQQIRKAHGYKELVMIGDGATDLERRFHMGKLLWSSLASALFGFRDVHLLLWLKL